MSIVFVGENIPPLEPLELSKELHQELVPLYALDLTSVSAKIYGNLQLI